MHPFRFGVSATRPRSKAEWIAFVKRVEALGYDSLVMPDHFGSRFSLAPALVLAAEATTRLRVGSLVYDNDFRHPAVLAQEVATIDRLTEGRFDFGIGAGWLKREYDAAGIAFDSGRLRVERLEEALAIIKQWLSGEPVSSIGRYYRINELIGAAPTVQRPHPPILLGGGGRRLLSLAAQEADIISVMPRSRPDGSGLEDDDATETAFQAKIGWIRERAGVRFEQIVLHTLVQVVTLTDNVPRELQRLSEEWHTPPTALLESPLILIGSVDELAEAVRRRREALGISYLTVFEKDVESFSEVITQVRKSEPT
jgi:probable F420-dependent oxidoreductase